MMAWTDILFSGFNEEEKTTSLALLERMGENAINITNEYFSEDVSQ